MACCHKAHRRVTQLYGKGNIPSYPELKQILSETLSAEYQRAGKSQPTRRSRLRDRQAVSYFRMVEKLYAAMESALDPFEQRSRHILCWRCPDLPDAAARKGPVWRSRNLIDRLLLNRDMSSLPEGFQPISEPGSRNTAYNSRRPKPPKWLASSLAGIPNPLVTKLGKKQRKGQASMPSGSYFTWLEPNMQMVQCSATVWC